MASLIESIEAARRSILRRCMRNKMVSTLRGYTACVIEFCGVLSFHKQMCSDAEAVQSGPQKALHRLLGSINNRLVFVEARVQDNRYARQPPECLDKIKIKRIGLAI
jgi:hypothetical protein